MATYLQRYILLADQDFSYRIKIAMMMAAYTIQNEGGAVPQHVRRLQWANRVQQDAIRTPMRLIALRVLLDPAVDGTSSDPVLQARIDLLVTDLIPLEVDTL